MNSQPIKDILRYHKTAMPYTRRQQEKKQVFGKNFLSVLHDQTLAESLKVLLFMI